MHESEVAQLCPVLVSPWTAAYQAPPSMGFSMDGDSPWTLFRVLEWVAIAFSETYKTTTHSLKKKKKNLPFVTTWTDLEDIVLSERSEIEKDKYHMISLMAGPEPCRDNGT